MIMEIELYAAQQDLIKSWTSSGTKYFQQYLGYQWTCIEKILISLQS